MQAVGVQNILSQVVVEVIGGIGKGGEDQYLFIPVVNRVHNLVQDKIFQMLQLGIIVGRDFLHRSKKLFEQNLVCCQFMFPPLNVHITQADLNFPSDFNIFR